MKTLHKLTLSGVAVLAAVSSQAQSTNSTSRFFATMDGGVAWQQDARIRDNSAFLLGTGNVKFDTGFRAGATFGYNLSDTFAIALEAGVIQNDITEVGGGQKLSSFPGGRATLDQIPVLLNGVYTLPLKGAFKPYVGLGLGTVIGVFDSAHIPGSSSAIGNEKFNSTDFTVAGQVELGCKYELTKNIDLGLAYKFVATTDHDWSDNNIHLKTDGSMTHAIEATFNWRF
jgi:opacity protein-like surface antigen